jgi:antitoxin (DNA-binding transcriptional repressor) of toxin-antitoxin stability system
MVYIVHTMKHWKVAEARARFGEILDEAERGNRVVVERRGVRFRLTAESPQPRRGSAKPLFEFVDPSLADGQWTWRSGSRGLTFSARKRR